MKHPAFYTEIPQKPLYENFRCLNSGWKGIFSAGPTHEMLMFIVTVYSFFLVNHRAMQVLTFLHRHSCMGFAIPEFNAFCQCSASNWVIATLEVTEIVIKQNSLNESCIGTF